MPGKDLTTAEAAQKLQMSERTIRRMIIRGSISAHKLDPTAKSVYRIPQSEVDRLLAERATPANAGK
jgi:excisionase family DNA binding protein